VVAVTPTTTTTDATTDATSGAAQQETCGQHAALGDELRALVLAAIDRIGLVLDRMRAEPTGRPAGAAGRHGAPTCAACPVCALLAAFRGERPELAAQLAEQAAGLLAVLRALLDEGAPDRVPDAAPGGPPAGGPTGNRRVQHIRVDRPSR
jgi:hypothetical protein